MTATDLGVLIGAVAGLLALLGGGAKWLLDYIKGMQAAAALKESEARADLSTRLQQEIAELRAELAQMRVMSNVYLKRVYQLENFIHQQPGIQIPVMDGWPPA